MINLSANQLQGWVAELYWPFVRIGSCFMIVPVFGAETVPARVRVVLAGAITLLIAPLLPAPPPIAPFSAAGCVITVQQVLIGVAFGFCVHILFDAVTLGGQMLGNSMGLSMAMNVDPLHGSDASTPAVGQIYTLLVTLTFLGLNGHLALIEVLVKSFTTLPLGVEGLGTAGLATVVGWGAQLFAGALVVALPGVTALLIVNLAFGVMSRAAPSFNLFAIGLPVSLVFGLVILTMGLPAVQATFMELMARSFAALEQLAGALG